jgi:hypothetical protein
MSKFRGSVHQSRSDAGSDFGAFQEMSSTSTEKKVCDITWITQPLFFWTTFLPTSDISSGKSPSKGINKSKNMSPVKETEEERNARLEEEFSKYLGVKPVSRPTSRVLSRPGSNANGINSETSPELNNLKMQQDQKAHEREQERRRLERLRVAKEIEDSEQKLKNMTDTLNIVDRGRYRNGNNEFDDYIEETIQKIKDTNDFQNQNELKLHEQLEKEKSPINKTNGLVGAFNGTDNNKSSTQAEASVNIIDLENFEKLLSNEGLVTLTYLPTKDGGSKSKDAIIKCERLSTIISCEITSQGQKRKLKFDIAEVKAIKKGKGSILIDDRNDVVVMHFVVTNKPDLNLVFDSEQSRDMVVAGFKYLVNKRSKL